MPRRTPARRGMVFLVGWFSGVYAASDFNAHTGISTGSLDVASPWGSNEHLAAVLLPSGLPDGPITIAKALAVPPVSRAVQLYSTAIASFPLTSAASDAPAWLNNTAGAVSPGLRNALTLQDLLFTAACLWSYEDDGSVMRVPREAWSVDEDGDVVDKEGNKRDSESYIYIPSLLPMGFLTFGQNSVNHYHGILRAILDRSDNPIPITELKVKDQTEADPEEVKQAQKNYADARRAKNGSVTVTPVGVDLIVHEAGNDANTMLTEARNAVRLDMANFLNINAAMLDGNNGTSDTYSNTLQNQNEFLTLSLRTFLTPIEQRLSQPDVVGAPVRFDTSAFDTTNDAAGNTGSAANRTETTRA